MKETLIPVTCKTSKATLIILVLMIKNFILAKGADKRIRFFVKFSLCREYVNTDCDYDNDEKAEEEEIENHIFYSQENPRWSRLPAAVSISVPTALSASAFLSSFIVFVLFFTAVSVPFINVINERKQSQKLPSTRVQHGLWLLIGKCKTRPYWEGPQWGITSFDNVGQAMLTVFQVTQSMILDKILNPT